LFVYWLTSANKQHS